MKKPSVLTLALAVLLAGAVTAFAQDVRYNFDKQANFSQFKTYKWVTLKGAQVPNELVDMQIKAAVDMELATKGLKRTELTPLTCTWATRRSEHRKEYLVRHRLGATARAGGGGWYGGGG